MDKPEKKQPKPRKTHELPTENPPKRAYRSSKKQFLTESDKEKMRNSCQVCFMQFSARKTASSVVILLKMAKIRRISLGKLKITCTKCEMSVHLGCYGLQTPFSSIKTEDLRVRNEFLCDLCSVKAKAEKFECVVCSNSNEFCQAFKTLFPYKKEQKSVVHVLCGLFSPNITVFDWGQLRMEFSAEKTCASEKEKSEIAETSAGKNCSICLKTSKEVWSCEFCEKKAHFICMFIDKVLVSGEESRNWTFCLRLFPGVALQKYEDCASARKQQVAKLAKALKSCANARELQKLSNFSKFSKSQAEVFADQQLEIAQFWPKARDSHENTGKFRGKSRVCATIFCPEHYKPLCCYEKTRENGGFRKEKSEMKTDFLQEESVEKQEVLQGNSSIGISQEEEFVLCDYCETWTHVSCENAEKEILMDTFFCKSCEKWYKNRVFLENFLEKPLKKEDCPRKNAKKHIFVENPAQIREILGNFPQNPARMPLEDLIFVTSALETTFSRLFPENGEVFEEIPWRLLRKCENCAPFAINAAVYREKLEEIASSWLEKRFFSEIVCETMLSPLKSLFSEAEEICVESREIVRTRVQELRDLRENRHENHENREKSEDFELFPTNFEAKLDILEAEAQILLKIQSILVDFRETREKVALETLKDLCTKAQSHANLANFQEIRTISKELSDFEAIVAELTQKLCERETSLTNLRQSLDFSLTKRAEKTNASEILKEFAQKLGFLHLQGVAEVRAVEISRRFLDDSPIDAGKVAIFAVLARHLAQIREIDAFLSSGRAFSQAMLRESAENLLSCLVFSAKSLQIAGFYEEMQRFALKLRRFKRLRDVFRVENAFFVAENERSCWENHQVFEYFAHNCKETADFEAGDFEARDFEARDFEAGDFKANAEQLRGTLSLEHVAELLKVGKSLFFVDFCKEIAELEQLLKKAHVFNETLRYIIEQKYGNLPDFAKNRAETAENLTFEAEERDFAMKSRENARQSLEIPFTIAETLGNLKEINLFLPNLLRFQAERRKISLFRAHFLGDCATFGPPSTEIVHFFELSAAETLKTHVLQEIYAYLQRFPREISLKTVQLFEEAHEFFGKSRELHGFAGLSPYEQLFLQEFHTLSRLFKEIAAAKARFSLKTHENREKTDDFQEILASAHETLDFLLEDPTKLAISTPKVREMSFFDEFSRKLLVKHRLLLISQRIFRVFEQNSRDFLEISRLEQEIREFCKENPDESREILEKQVLFQEFALCCAQISRFLRGFDDEMLRVQANLEETERKLAIFRQKFKEMALEHAVFEEKLRVFEACAVWSRKVQRFLAILRENNKKFDYNALKTLVEFAKKFEFCAFFPGFGEITAVYEKYEAVFEKVAAIKAAFAQKKAELSLFKVSSLKILHEKVLPSEKFAYSGAIYHKLSSSLPRYESVKDLLEELSSMKIDTKALRESLSRCKTRTELFGKAVEKLKREKTWPLLQENTVFDWLSCVILLRNDLISQEILPSLCVDEFRAFEWTLSAISCANGWVSFVDEPQLPDFLTHFSKKRRKVANSQRFLEKLLDEVEENAGIFAVFAQKCPIFHEIRQKITLNLQVFARLRENCAEIELNAAQLRGKREETREKLRKDATFRAMVATQRRLFPKIGNLQQILEEIARTNVTFYAETARLTRLSKKTREIQAEIARFRSNCRRLFLLQGESWENARKTGKTRKTRRLQGVFERLLRKMLASPVFLEESEEFLLLLEEVRAELKENAAFFAQNSRFLDDRRVFLGDFLQKVAKSPFFEAKRGFFERIQGLYKQFPNFSEDFPANCVEIAQTLDRKLGKRKYMALFADLCYFFASFFGKSPLKLAVLRDFAAIFAKNLAICLDFLKEQAHFPDFRAKTAEILKDLRVLDAELRKSQGKPAKIEEFPLKSVDFSEIAGLSQAEVSHLLQILGDCAEACEKVAQTLENGAIALKMELEAESRDEKWREYAIFMENVEISSESLEISEENSSEAE